MREVRYYSGVELRYAGGKPRLAGYAAVFNRDSLPFGDGLFVERISPGAFKRSLKDSDIRAFDSHDQSKIVGRESNGTLSLKEDERGLRVEITPPDTSVGRDLVENVRSGLLDGMSIGFTLSPDAVLWDFKSKPAIRHIREAGLVEVSVVAIPAFPDTSVALRSFEEAMKQQGPRAAELKAMLEAKMASWKK
jgi:uncharacterized protein